MLLDTRTACCAKQKQFFPFNAALCRKQQGWRSMTAFSSLVERSESLHVESQNGNDYRLSQRLTLRRRHVPQSWHPQAESGDQLCHVPHLMHRAPAWLSLIVTTSNFYKNDKMPVQLDSSARIMCTVLFCMRSISHGSEVGLELVGEFGHVRC